MRLILLFMLLAFPIAEIWILINLTHRYGWWVLLYLVVVGWLGLQLVREEKQLFSVKMMQSLAQGGNPVRAVFGSARNMIAGILLIIPGVLTDAIAAILLLIPMKQPKLAGNPSDSEPYQEQTYQREQYQEKSFKHQRKASNDEVIDAEFTEIKEETDKK